MISLNDNALNYIKKESSEYISKGLGKDVSKDVSKENDSSIENNIKDDKSSNHIASDNKDRKVSSELSMNNVYIKNKVVKSKNDSLIQNNEKDSKNLYSANEFQKSRIEKKDEVNDGSLSPFVSKNQNNDVTFLPDKKILDIPQWGILKNREYTQNTTPNLTYTFKQWGSEKHQIQIRFMLDNQLQLIASTGRVYQASIDSFNQYQGRYALSLENREKSASWHINAIDNDDSKNSEDNR